jgi:hypothetical protein
MAGAMTEVDFASKSEVRDLRRRVQLLGQAVALHSRIGGERPSLTLH